MHKLDPSIGPDKWRRSLEARFQFNALRCRQQAEKLTDPEEKMFTLNLAELWGQLAEAARFRHELRSSRDSRPSRSQAR